MAETEPEALAISDERQADVVEGILRGEVICYVCAAMHPPRHHVFLSSAVNLCDPCRGSWHRWFDKTWGWPSGDSIWDVWIACRRHLLGNGN